MRLDSQLLVLLTCLASLTTAPDRLMASDSGLSNRRPNIILVLVDDMGYSDLGCYGGEIETPNIDKLASGGLQFTQFYNQGRCCPTRAALMTGLQPHQVGIGHMTSPPGQGLGFKGPYQGYLNDNCTTLAAVLKVAGYHTLMTGKWHLGADRRECWPLQRGFDKYYGCISGAINYFKPGGDRGITEGNEPVDTPEGWYATDAFTDRAIEYIQAATKSDDRPFFLYLAYNAPHWPLNAKISDFEKYRGKYATGWRSMMEARQERQKQSGLLAASTQAAPHNGPRWEALSPNQRDRLDAVMAAYAGCVDSIDQNIGKLVSFLEVSGQDESTIILFMSDNGACQEGGKFGNGGEVMVRKPPLETTDGVQIGLQWAEACNTPYRKFKHFVHEGGYCTPMIVDWPAGIPADRRGTMVHQTAYLQDIMATVIDIAGADYPAGIPVCQGKSMLPLMEGKYAPIHSDPLFWEHEGNAAVRWQDWKLVREYEKPWELYDLSTDRTELHDLSADMPDLRSDLIAKWEDWATQTGVAFPERFNMYEFLQQKNKK